MDYALACEGTFCRGHQNGHELAVTRSAPCLLHQPKYNLFDRTPERGLFDVLFKEGIGSIVFCPLAQDLLTSRYLSGSPADARAARDPRFLKPGHITEEKIARTRSLDAIAR